MQGEEESVCVLSETDVGRNPIGSGEGARTSIVASYSNAMCNTTVFVIRKWKMRSRGRSEEAARKYTIHKLKGIACNALPDIYNALSLCAWNIASFIVYNRQTWPLSTAALALYLQVEPPTTMPAWLCRLAC